MSEPTPRLTLGQASARSGVSIPTGRNIAKKYGVPIRKVGGVEYIDHTRLLEAVREERK